jgi:hypothetical protein
MPSSFVPYLKPLLLAGRVALSQSMFSELLFGALAMADVAGGLLVRPVLLPRFAEAASG